MTGPVIVREYMQIGLNRRRLEMDPGQLHVKIVETTPEDVEEPGPRISAVLPISELVGAGDGGLVCVPRCSRSGGRRPAQGGVFPSPSGVRTLQCGMPPASSRSLAPT